MLTLFKKENDYVIEHSSAKEQPVSYRFNRWQLTDKAFAHLQSLHVFEATHQTVFLLDEKQDHRFADVLDKLIHEHNSEYIFSVQLQRTYLTELIHLITKAHHARLAMFE